MDPERPVMHIFRKIKLQEMQYYHFYVKITLHIMVCVCKSKEEELESLHHLLMGSRQARSRQVMGPSTSYLLPFGITSMRYNKNAFLCYVIRKTNTGMHNITDQLSFYMFILFQFYSLFLFLSTSLYLRGYAFLILLHVKIILTPL